MNRQQFLEQLEAELSGLAPVERQEALKFYVEYLDEAGPENEAAVLAELGSPQKVAAIIRANLGLSDESAAPHETPKPSLTLDGPDWSRKTEQQAQSGAPGAGSAAYGGQPFPKSKNNSRVLLVLLLVFTSPLWIGILGGLFGALMGLLGGILGIFIGGISAIAGSDILSVYAGRQPGGWNGQHGAVHGQHRNRRPSDSRLCVAAAPFCTMAGKPGPPGGAGCLWKGGEISHEANRKGVFGSSGVFTGPGTGGLPDGWPSPACALERRMA